MTDYISRKEAIEAICAMECGDDSEYCPSCGADMREDT